MDPVSPARTTLRRSAIAALLVFVPIDGKELARLMKKPMHSQEHER